MPVTHNFSFVQQVDIDKHNLQTSFLGRTSVSGSMSWKPAKGNFILVFVRGSNATPVQLETESSWMWHSLNAYEIGEEIIADFIGYQNPDHIIGADTSFFRGDLKKASDYKNNRVNAPIIIFESGV
jgi:carotenoid cleavage dioxygenase-like enzyme